MRKLIAISTLVLTAAAIHAAGAAADAPSHAAYVPGELLVRFDAATLRLAESENREERRYAAALTDCLGNISTVLTLRLQAATRRLLGQRLAAVVVPFRRNVALNEVKWCIVDLMNNGKGDLDHSAIVTFIEHMAGVEVKKASAAKAP